jgi:flagellar biogenesis protein FliO
MNRLRTFGAGIALGASIFVAQAHGETSAAPTHTAIPYKQEKQPTESLAYQTIGSLALVTLIGYAVVLMLKKFNGVSTRTSEKRRLKVTEVLRLSRRSTLYVVDYQGRELLIAEHEHEIRQLDIPVREAANGEHDA